MPRTARRDAPGAIHHVTLRGVGQCDIFVDDRDREFFFDRIQLVTSEEGASVLGFAFMSNHVHLVIKTGATPLSTVMARIATAYALYFNRRHNRVGHLFQNRYNAKPIRDEAHLRNSIRYAHTNPLEAGLATGLAALERYRWAGHGALLGTQGPGFLDVAAALSAFGATKDQARDALRAFMRDWKQAREPHTELAPLLLPMLEAEIAAQAARFGVRAEQIASGARQREACRARAEVAHLAIAVHGLPTREVALRLGVTHAAVLRAAARAGRRRGGTEVTTKYQRPLTSPFASGRVLRRGGR